jgi:hypothetical protein
MIRRTAVVVPALTLLLLLPADARAQSFGDVALVATESPVFLLPDATRTPLRRLPVGMALTILRRQGEWLQVSFEDPQLGRRTGWIEAKSVRIRPASAEPAPDAPTTPQAKPGDSPPRTPAAQSRRPARRPAVQPLGVRAFGGGAIEWMTASKSFDAVTGSNRVFTYGGGVQVTNVWQGLFIEGAVTRAAVDGERVFASGDEVFPLGIPLELTMMPVDIVVGWRSPMGRYVPYVGGGLTLFKYQETSDFADEDDNIDEWYRGFVITGGVEVGVARWVHVRVDGRYRQVNDALGLGGVSQVFDEKRLGGFSAGLQLVIGR